MKECSAGKSTNHKRSAIDQLQIINEGLTLNCQCQAPPPPFFLFSSPLLFLNQTTINKNLFPELSLVEISEHFFQMKRLSNFCCKLIQSSFSCLSKPISCKCFKVVFSIVLSSIFTHDSEFPTNENRENVNDIFSFPFVVNVDHIFQGLLPLSLTSANANFIPQMSQIGHFMKPNFCA